MERNELMKLTTAGVLAAIITMMTFTPYVGYISYGALSITTLHIPVIIGAILLGPMYGAFLGAVWGIDCLIYAVIGATSDGAIFVNPIISVVPRIIVGIVAAFVFIGLEKLIKIRFVAIPLTAIAATLTNTVLVLTAIHLFGSHGIVLLSGIVKDIFMVAISLNGLVELIAAIILVPAIVKTLDATKLSKKF